MVILQGRRLGSSELGQVTELIGADPEWTRYRLSRESAWRWDWRSPSGQLKDLAVRTLPLKLEARGWIRLPPRRRASPNRMRHKRVAPLYPRLSQALRCARASLRLTIRFQSAARRPRIRHNTPTIMPRAAGTRVKAASQSCRHGSGPSPPRGFEPGPSCAIERFPGVGACKPPAA